MNNCQYKIFKSDKSPQELFVNFKDDRLPFLLESSRNVTGMGRYSFLGSNPFLILKVKNGCCIIEENGQQKNISGQPLVVLRQLLENYSLKGKPKHGVPFLCGAVGFFAYDFGFYLEKVERKNSYDSVVPEFIFGFYDCVICFDHLKKEVVVFSCGFPENGSARKVRAAQKLREVVNKLQGTGYKVPATNASAGRQVAGSREREKITSNFTKKGYIAAVEKAKEYISAGDIYQVNLSQMFKTYSEISDWGLYERLTRNFPVSFSAFFKDMDFSIMSASPEKFLNFDGRVVSTRPMKGTRKRTINAEHNIRLKRDLEKSKKERAELLMIVDLERNDLGRVCDYGSIKVRQLRKIESYLNVFQATAEIEGVLHKNKDRIDLIRACFPGGSVTGAPKIRAMEVIEELEPHTRSVYTGSLGYLSFHNTMQFNILIRSFLKKGNEVFFNVGGGIVTDSKPKAEYEETLIKAKALFDSLKNK